MTLPPTSPVAIEPPVGVRPPRAWLGSAGAIDLSGTWRFALVTHDLRAPQDPGEDWGAIEVPGHWQLQGHGSPAYTNVVFPIPVDPPRVPVGPVGEYRTWIEVPPAWRRSGRVVLRFEGVDSWFAVAVDGTWLATSSGSRLPTEIDVTDALGDGPSLLAVRVHQWSAMTYLEDQDQWWLSGIFRPVLLLHRPEGGVEDLTIDADYDHLGGLGSLTVRVDADNARVTVPELGIDVAAGTRVEVPVEPWSAERPRLYEMTVTTEAESVTVPVGFRRVETDGGVLRVNGRAVKLRGVNRHEFDPERGRAVTASTMRADVELMKRHHVNAVRTAHQPPHPDFLALCDRYGLYVVLENDLETHGFEQVGWRGNPTDDPAWTAVMVDRVRRTVARDAHHPSVVMWSLGNESGTGRNVAAMAAAVREFDPTRPVHYEGEWDSASADVYSRMYASCEEVERIGRGTEEPLPDAALDARRRSLPFVLCEYAHAMGNGPGGLAAYDRLFDTYPRLAGGFVWEWIDHGLTTTAPDGTAYFGYGGDFGEELHDGTFVADGLLLPDRLASPGLIELAAVYAPIRVTPGTDPGTVVVRNRYAHLDTSRTVTSWELRADGEVVISGELPVPVLPPGQSAALPLPPTVAQVADTIPPDRELRVRVTTRSTRPASPGVASGDDGLVIGDGELRWRRAVRPAPSARALPPVSGPAGRRSGPVLIDPTGRPLALGAFEAASFGIHAWRAPTDNDRGEAHGVEPAAAELWRADGLDRLVETTQDVVVEGDEVVVRTRAAGAGVDRGLSVTYRWRAVDEGTVDLRVDVDPWGRWSGSWPRIGLRLGLREPDPAEVWVQWWGQGPGEAYPDSASAVRDGRYSMTVAELQTRYTHPQENGARRGVRRAVLSGTAGGLTVTELGVTLGGVDQEGLVLTVRPWTDRQLERAAHPHELVAGDVVWLHLDVAHQGLGSASCGEGVQPEARLLPAPARLDLRWGVTTG